MSEFSLSTRELSRIRVYFDNRIVPVNCSVRQNIPENEPLLKPSVQNYQDWKARNLGRTWEAKRLSRKNYVGKYLIIRN
jgi:hypothetical protein